MGFPASKLSAFRPILIHALASSQSPGVAVDEFFQASSDDFSWYALPLIAVGAASFSGWPRFVGSVDRDQV
jgi:hypothetical protein